MTFLRISIYLLLYSIATQWINISNYWLFIIYGLNRINITVGTYILILY